MSNYVIYKDQALLDSGTPTAHAIVIGVGDYPHLIDGDGPLTTKNGGLRQLSSPPESARTFSTWLLDEFHNPNKPLATVSLLISEPGDTTEFNHPKLAAAVTPEEATIANVKAAIREWKAFGDRSEENLVLFFFCGHGVARGLEGVTLLLSDYGASNDMPMEGAIDFAALHRGMAQCKASEQCYFIDACRTVSDIATRTTECGDSIIQDDQNRPYPSDWNFAIIYSTLGGEKAYGRKNKPSFYTEELITGLNGTGSNNRSGDGSWRVTTGDLNTAIHYGLSLRGDKIKIPMAYLAQFEFHYLKNQPLVPVTIYCKERSENSLATFSCIENGHQIGSRPPDPDDWITKLTHGRYDFTADIDTRHGERKDESIIPPYREIEIEVAP